MYMTRGRCSRLVPCRSNRSTARIVPQIISRSHQRAKVHLLLTIFAMSPPRSFVLFSACESRKGSHGGLKMCCFLTGPAKWGLSGPTKLPSDVLTIQPPSFCYSQSSALLSRVSTFYSLLTLRRQAVSTFLAVLSFLTLHDIWDKDPL
jgi:hypothetical protein